MAEAPNELNLGTIIETINEERRKLGTYLDEVGQRGSLSREQMILMHIDFVLHDAVMSLQARCRELTREGGFIHRLEEGN